MILEAAVLDSCSYLCTSPVWHMIIGKRMETKVCFFIASGRPSEHTYEKDSERNVFCHFYGRKLQLCDILCFLGGLKAKKNTLNLSLLKLSLKSVVMEDSCITEDNSLYTTCPSTMSFSVGLKCENSTCALHKPFQERWSASFSEDCPPCFCFIWNTD